MKRSFTFYFLLTSLCFGGMNCTNKLTTVSGKTRQILATSMSPIIPVLKRIDHNPLLRIRVFIPAGMEDQQYRSLQCSVNGNALQDLQEIKIYINGTEPLFDARQETSSFVPNTTDFDIPLEAIMKPGLNYLWIGASLKAQADIDNRITFQARNLVDAQGKKQPVIPEGPDYDKRNGIAIRKINDDGVNSYRIPGIATTDKGTLLAVYDIRYKHSGDLPADIDVGLSRSTDGGHTWEPMKTIMDMGPPHENNGVGDPAILFDPVTKKIWVAALWSKGNRSIAGSEPGLSPDTTGQFVLVSSEDDGLTWSAPYSITSQVKNPRWHLYFNGPGNGIAMQDGTLVFPSQYWDDSKKPGIPHSSVIYSKDHGASWQSGIGAKYNTTEAQVVETHPNTLMLSMRDNRGWFRSVSTTTNLGKSWTEHPTSYKDIPDPVCMASLIKAEVMVGGKMKEVLFFSNPHTHTGRYNMTIQASLDLGETWLPAHQLLIDERMGFGYSSLTKIDDNTLGILYEGVRDLFFMRLPVKDIVK